MVADRSPVRELRLALTVRDFDAAVRFYRDVLDLGELEAWDDEHGRGIILEAGRATLELLSVDQAAYVDAVELGGPGQGTPDAARVALQVADSVATAAALVEAGADQLGAPVTTPWSHRNVRLRAPDGLQLTLFTPLDEAGGS